MSNRRRHGQGSRYQQQRRHHTTSSEYGEARRATRGGPHRLSDAVGEVFPDLALAQLFRRECSACGFTRLRWFPGVVAADILGADVASELLGQLPAEYREVAQCWQCVRCEESGAFGPTEWDPF